MEMQLKFVLSLSLKEMVLRRVAVLLSNDFEIPDPLDYSFDWKTMHNTNKEKVKYKISKLLLPESLRMEIIDKVRHFSLEIRKWTDQHQWMCFSAGVIDTSPKFVWTSAGTIDYIKTAEVLLGCEVLDVEKRFEFASFHCLKDYISLLWEELPEDRKEYFLNEASFLPYLEFCWALTVEGYFSRLNRLWRGSDRNLTSFNQWAFEKWAREGNKMAAEYFFRKLTNKERKVSVMRATLALLSHPPFGYFSDILCYLLSLMTPEQQMETMKEHPVRVLSCFCVMPWQDLLVKNANLIWRFLPTSGYGELSEKILDLVKYDQCHPKSFREFLIRSPLEYKNFFVYHEHRKYGNPAYSFLSAFISKEDSESIGCIFKNLDTADRAAIVFQPDVLNLFRRCEEDIVFNPHVLDIFCKRGEDRRRMVEVCLREAKLCKEDRERLKNERPDLRGVIEELYESDATPENEKKGQKRKPEDCCKYEIYFV